MVILQQIGISIPQFSKLPQHRRYFIVISTLLIQPVNFRFDVLCSMPGQVFHEMEVGNLVEVEQPPCQFLLLGVAQLILSH